MKRGNETREHQQLKLIVAHWLKSRGYEVLFEHQLVDVLGFRVETRDVTAVEIERSERNLLGNLRRNLANGFSNILIVAPDQVRRDRYRKILKRYPKLTAAREVRCVSICELE